MSLFTSIWNNVSMSVAKAASNQLFRAVTMDTVELLRYGNRVMGRHTLLATKRVGLGIASSISMSNAVSAYEHYRQLEALKEARLQQWETKTLIENRIKDNEQSYGHVSLEGFDVQATDINGHKVPEALILYYKGEQDITVTEDTIGGEKRTKGTTKYVYFVDTAAEVSCDTSKNVILTTVQGRDYSRKELVSGGDLKFSINGAAVSHVMDMYPENEVKKLISIAQYGGIVEVNNLIFGQFNVNKIIITSFRLEKQTCKNIQPYTMSCVAVEPDEDVVVVSDTIDLINYNIQKQNRNTIDDVALVLRETGRLTGLDYSLADFIHQIGGGAI